MSPRALLDADMPTVGRWIASGVRWWLAELSLLVPRRWREAGGGAGGERLTFDAATGTLIASGERRSAFAAAGRRGAIVVPRELCLLRQIERPLMADRDLQRMLALDGDRLMPSPAGEMLVAGRWAEQRVEAGRGTAEVAGLPLARARAVAAAVAAAGVVPVRVPVAREPGDPLPPIDLLPAMTAAGLIVPSRGTAPLWWALVTFLFLFNIGMIVWRDAASVDRLAQIVAEQEPAVATARLLNRRVARGDYIVARATMLRRRYDALAMLALTSRAVPDRAWVQRLSWETGSLRISGYRANGVDVAGALRRTAGLRDVRNANAEEAAAVPAGQPFDITARLGSR